MARLKAIVRYWLVLFLLCLHLAACKPGSFPVPTSDISASATLPASPTVMIATEPTAQPSFQPSKTLSVETSIPDQEGIGLPSASLSPSSTSTPQPSVLADCPPPDPIPPHQPAEVVLVGDQQAWYWEEAAGMLHPYPLPSPDPTNSRMRWIEVSEDGRFVAYQLPADQPPPASRPPLYSTIAGQRDLELWLLDRQTGQSRRVAGPPPDETVQRYPDETEFYYEARWIGGSHLLGFASHPVYNETPTYEAYHLLDADTNRAWMLFPGGEVGAVIFRPDGAQAAAIAISGVWNDPQGELSLIEAATGSVEWSIPLELKYGGRWQRLSYAPDGQHLAVMVSNGIAVVDVTTGDAQTVPLEFNCQGPGSGFCSLPTPLWAEDGQSFTVWVEEAPPAGSSTPIQVTQYLVSWSANGKLMIYTGITIHTGWGTRLVSPDGRFLLYATTQAQAVYFLQALPNGEPVRYLEGDNYSRASWSPDSRRFLMIEHGNNRTLGLSLGHICERPKTLPLPERGHIWNTLWIDTDRFLVLVQEETGAPAGPQVTLYRYDLSQPEPQPVEVGAITLQISSSLNMFLVDP